MMRIGPGPTVFGEFRSVEEARRCVLDLRRAGFEEDEVGFSAPADRPAMVSVMAGERWAEARLILAGQGSRPMTGGRRRSPIREAVERLLRRRLGIEPVGEFAEDRRQPHRDS